MDNIYTIKYIIRTFVLFFAALLIFNNGNAQKDTIYYDSNWKLTIKDSASYYRPPIKKEGSLFRVKDYFINGTLQMTALSKSAKKDIWQGKVVWNNKDGSVLQEAIYANNRLEGDFITYLNGKRLVAKYENGRVISGEQNTKSGSQQIYYRKVGDTIISTFYQDNLKGIRFDRYGLTGTYELFTKYYGNDGSYIGKREYIKGVGDDGVSVTYYRNPMLVKEIRYNEKGKFLGNSSYYPNGQLREEFKQGPKFLKVFYNSSGKKIGEIIYKQDQYGLKPFNGTDYSFYYAKNNKDGDLIRRKSSYKDGLLEMTEEFYENKKLKQQITYDKGVKQLVLSFNEQGKEVAQMSYDGYKPFDGKEIIGNTELEYKDGKLIEEIKYYPKSKSISSKKTNLEETFYDIEGKVMGKLSLQDDGYGYNKPVSGLRFSMDYEGKISSIEKYEDGYVHSRTNFRKRKVGKEESKTFKRIEIYEPNGYKKVKEITFYSNGKKQSEITYKDYKEVSGVYYDDKENMIGNYDYTAKNGTLYKFFYDSDKVQEIQVLENGKQSKLKRYDYGKEVSYGQINPVLVEDVDVNCCAMFYDRDGNVMGKTVFKEGKAWEGVLVDLKTKQKFTLTDGKKEGQYQKLSYNGYVLEEGNYVNDKKEGVFKYFDYLKKLRKTELYNDGKLNGESIFYSSKDEILGKVAYSNGQAMNGTVFLGTYAEEKSNRKTYKNGKLTKSIKYDDNGKRVTEYNDHGGVETIAYFKDSDKKRLSFATQNAYVHGEVIRYNEEGAEQNRAIFDNGKLKSGTVYLTSYDGNLSHSIFTKEKDKLTLVLVSTTKKVVFKAEEDLLFDNYSNYIKKLGFYLDYIKPEQLY